MVCGDVGAGAVAVSCVCKPPSAIATRATPNIDPTTAFPRSQRSNERRSSGDRFLYWARISPLVMATSRLVNGQMIHAVRSGCGNEDTCESYCGDHAGEFEDRHRAFRVSASPICRGACELSSAACMEGAVGQSF